MAFFDLFWRPRTRCAPTSSRKRVCCSLELLESRLVPSTISGPSPAGPVAVPPPATPSSINTTASALTQQALPVLGASTGGLTGAAPAQIANDDYAVTWPSDPQVGNVWNVYTPPPAASGGPQGGALPVYTAPAGVQTGAAAANTGDSFNITWISGSMSSLIATRP
jgi:hypothetical protein